MKKTVLGSVAAAIAATGLWMNMGAGDQRSPAEQVLKYSKQTLVSTVKEAAGLDIGPDKSMRASTDPERDKKAKEELGYSLGMQAYLYGLPSMRLEEFRAGINRLATVTQKLGMSAFGPSSKDGVQYNELLHTRILSTPEIKVGITPNNDTMYSSAYYDLAKEPLVMTVPDIPDRYYSVQIVDAYLSNAAYIGTRATQSKPGDYLLAGPDWRGEVPADMELIRLPTNEGFLALRILVAGPDDADNVIALQDQFELIPLSARLGQTMAARLPAIPEPRLEGELHHYRRIVEIAQRNPPPGCPH